jgi:hypothetical protein
MKRLLSVALFAAIVAFSFCAPASALPAVQGNFPVPDSWCSAVTPGYPLACVKTIGDTPFAAAVTTTLTQFIAAPTAPSAIRITFIQFAGIESATGGELYLEQGTGTNCGTSTAIVADLTHITASTGFTGFYAGSPAFVLKPGFAACIEASAGTVTAAEIAGTAAIW